MKKVSQKSTFFGGAAILAVGIAIVKLIGALYKIPIANILGDEGNGHFNNAYVIYNLLLMVSTAGLPIALSKTISEANTLGWRNQVDRIFRVSLSTFVILGIVSLVVMFGFAEPLADWQGNSLAAPAVRALAPACLFVCIISAYRGYAQGHGNMVPTTISQIIEALGKLIIGITLAYVLMQNDAGTPNAAAGAIFGVTAGAAIALVYLIFEHQNHRRKLPLQPTGERADGALHILKRLMIIAVPITLGASVVPVTTWLDTFQIQTILREVMSAENAQFYQTNGIVDPVVSAYGAYQVAINVFNLPSSFMVALTACIIPAISACWTKKDQKGVGNIAESSLRVGVLLAFPAGLGLTVLASPIMHLLYTNTDHSVADPSMMVLGLASIFVCIMFLCNAILQASGFVNLPIIAMLVGCVAKLLVNNALVRQEDIGIVGAPVGTLVCYLLVAGIELALIKRVLPSPPKYRRVFLRPLIAAVIMAAAAWGVFGLLSRLLLLIESFGEMVDGTLMLTGTGNAIATLVTILVAVAVYATLVVFLRAISREDLALMPKGDRIAKLLRLPE